MKSNQKMAVNLQRGEWVILPRYQFPQEVHSVYSLPLGVVRITHSKYGLQQTYAASDYPMTVVEDGWESRDFWPKKD